MLEVHVVTDRNRFLYEGAYASHAPVVASRPSREMPCPIPARLLRQDDLLGCCDPVVDGGTLLLGIEEGRVAAASRLMPSCGPNRLRGLPQLAVERGLPDRAQWADWTRLPAEADACAAREEVTFAAMACAVMEYALEEGVEWVGGVEDAYWLPRWESLGWHVQVLGLPARIEGASKVAAFMRVDERSLASARRLAGTSRPVLRRHGPQKPFLPAMPPHSLSPHRPETKHAR
ncbi:acyl-homoserine-lactone synthase [Aureimonas sp. AU4]|uniref:acyl-homoserine-lactone synthase n=1 Tax=Aureimonas sp. AU4 TaxID=1638163 RepID=UPI000784AFC0|nr:acyl-homoserine-lactone synthase [Aureimonas sp. AU4]